MSEKLLRVQDYIRAFGDIEQIELLLADVNGIWRGKRLPAAAAAKIDAGKLAFPFNTVSLTTEGAVSAALADQYGAEPDRRARVVPGRVHRVPWAPAPTLQVMIDLEEEDQTPLFNSPRRVLAAIVEQFKARGLTPVVAVELEFTLFTAGSVPPSPAEPPSGQVAVSGEQCHNLELLGDFDTFMAAVQAAARAQGLEVISLLKESSEAQFEINLIHRADALAAADEAMMLKRLVRGVAAQSGMLASFMAKPRADLAGNGLHVHLSLLNRDGVPVFSADELSLKAAVAGLLSHMDAAMAFYAPNANSYRRFSDTGFAPNAKVWAENNRFASVRLPFADADHRRIEFRTAGADASPHLAVAAVLASVLAGLEAKAVPPAAMGEFEKPPADAARAAPRWREALNALGRDSAFRALFDPRFLAYYEALRRREEADFAARVTQAEYDTLLRVL